MALRGGRPRVSRRPSLSLPDGYTQASSSVRRAFVLSRKVAGLLPKDAQRHSRSPKGVVGAPLPISHENARVEWWDRWADESYGRVVFYLDKARRCYLDTHLKAFGISSAHMPVLTYLWEGHEGDTQAVIADVVGVDPATVTRISQKLETLGYIRRDISSRDSRALCLSLTESGWNLADSAQAISSAWTEQVTKHLSARRRADVLHAVQRITVRAQEICGCDVPPSAGDDLRQC